MGIYEAIKDVANVAQKADNIELYKMLLDVQKMTLDMQEEIIHLREENKKLKEDLTSKQKLTYHEDGFYTLENKDNSLDYLCSLCWDADKILVHIKKPDGYIRCPKCRSEIHNK